MDCILDDLVERLRAFPASEGFDKKGLVEAQRRSYNSIQRIQSSSRSMLVWSSAAEDRLPSAPLRGLIPIRAKDLQIGIHHRGRVLFGTLCADAHRIVGIMTVLEDQFGDGVRLSINGVSSSIRRTEQVRRLYPQGAKVAVKEPYLKRAQDGLLMVRVDSPAHIEILGSFEGNADDAEADLGKLRGKGNALFRAEDWKGAIEYYSKCIELVLSSQKQSTSSTAEKSQKEIVEGLLYSYSNRAEARLKLRQYAQAVEDSDKALQLDPLHLKSIFRKGKALHGLQEYNLACNSFQMALQQCPTADEIKFQYDRSKKLNDQNKQGKFDLSAYFLNGCMPEDAPEMSNYIGPVIIKKSEGRGRGLFATNDIEIGDTLLVENAVVMSETESDSTTTAEKVKENIMAEVISCAESSPRLMRQLQYFLDDDGEKKSKVPDIELFKINNGSWNRFNAHKKEKNIEAHAHKLKKAMELKVLLAHVKDDPLITTRRWGFWMLSCFISHSCFPNANCRVVGKAMFITACRNIAAGEEITVPYFESLVPLAKREEKCQEMGFRCECKRCKFERTLGPAFAKLGEYACTQHALLFLRGMIEYLQFFVKLAVQLQEEIVTQGDLITFEEKQLILASFQIIFSPLFAFPHLCPDINIISPMLPTKTELLESIQHAVPGSPASFMLFAGMFAEGELKGNTDNLLEKGLKVAITSVGRQEEDVLKAVLRGPVQMVFIKG